MNINALDLLWGAYSSVQFVLFGFSTNLASHFARSPLSHSYGYGSAADRTNCLASFALNPEPFVKYAGQNSNPVHYRFRI
jgi:hypothetical protein